MIKLTTPTTIFFAMATSAFAAGSHSGGHKHAEHTHGNVQSAGEHGHDEGHNHSTDHIDMMEVGMPGEHGLVTRTIEILMIETEDGEMLFKPNDDTIESLSFAEGETVLFKIINSGEFDHEFVLDTVENNEKHRELMEKFPEMEHDDPNSITLAPGEESQIVWTFSNPGDFQFACLIPGHMELGMHGPINVASN